MPTYPTRSDVPAIVPPDTVVNEGFVAVYRAGGEFWYWKPTNARYLELLISQATTHTVSTAEAAYQWNIYPDDTVFDSVNQLPAFNDALMVGTIIKVGTETQIKIYYPKDGVWAEETISAASRITVLSATGQPVTFELSATEFEAQTGSGETFSLQASGGVAPHTFLTGNGETLTIASDGSFDVGSKAEGVYSAAVTVQDAQGTTSQQEFNITLTITASAPPTLTDLEFDPPSPYEFIEGQVGELELNVLNDPDPEKGIWSGGPFPNFEYPAEYEAGVTAHLGMVRGTRDSNADAGKIKHSGGLPVGLFSEEINDIPSGAKSPLISAPSSTPRLIK